MPRLALLVICICLAEASLLVSAGAATTVRVYISASAETPVGAEAVVFPAKEGEAGGVTSDALLREYETAKEQIVFTKVNAGGRVDPFDVPVKSAAYRFLIWDQKSRSVYQGSWIEPSEKVKVEKLDKPNIAALEAIFSKKRSPTAAAASAATLEPTREKITPPGAATPQPAATRPPPPTGVPGAKAPEIPASTAHVPPGFFTRTFTGMLQILYILCCIIVVISCPGMFWLAWLQRKQLREGIDILQSQITTANREISRLHNEVSRLHNELAKLRPPAPSSEPAAQVPLKEPLQSTSATYRVTGGRSRTGSDDLLSPVEHLKQTAQRTPKQSTAALTQAFVEWCAPERNAIIHDLAGFERFLQERFGTVQVSSLYRDRNAGNENFKFTARSIDAQDPTEYWLVHSSEGGLLFPRPDLDDFCELFPVFESEGRMTPQRLRSITPGTLEPGEAGVYHLRQKGQVS